MRDGSLTILQAIACGCISTKCTYSSCNTNISRENQRYGTTAASRFQEARATAEVEKLAGKDSS